MNLEEINKNQATINIGTIGHVAHGKSTLVKQISTVSTIKYKSELERNITIKLGYANAKIFQCKKCPRPLCYASYASNQMKNPECKNKDCNGKMKLVRHVSFVDCPGHDVLMATMLTGTAIMDTAILLIASNEPCPQPQTMEHVFAIEIMNLDKIIIVQNKIDLISREKAIEHNEQIDEFLKGMKIERCPRIPASCQLNINIDAILDFIVNYIPIPARTKDLENNKKNDKQYPKMVIIRSFDINKPGCKIQDLKGGIIGGSLLTGIIRVGDKIEIRPGIITKEDGEIVCRPHVTVITSLKAEENTLELAVPGGLIGVGTKLDPFCCRADKLVGQVMGLIGALPNIFKEISVEYILFKKIALGGKTKDTSVAHIKKGEQLLLNIGSTTTGCTVIEIEGNKMKITLIKPACCEIAERIALSRKIGNHWRLIGYGSVLSGLIIEPKY